MRAFLMIIFEIRNGHGAFIVLNHERHPVIGSDAKTPTIVDQPVCLPHRKHSQFITMFHSVEKEELFPKLVNDPVVGFCIVIALVKALQSLVTEAMARF